jgi:uncharacterized protein YjbI with pentapeptide repeats
LATRSAATDDVRAPGGNPPAADPVVETAESVDTLRNTVVEAAGVSMGLWLSYLFVLFYFAIAAGGVTHRDLFFENPIKLPFLSVDLPLVGFFVLAPVLVLIVHAYVLLHVVLLSGKIRAFDDRLRATQIRNPGLQADALRRQLPSNIFVQYLAGPSDVRTGIMGSMLRLVAQISLVVCPVGLLVLLQLQFLPFHRWDVTWFQRVAVVLDIALLWTLWPSIARGQRRIAGAATASLATILVVFTLATYPGEWLNAMPSVRLVPTKWPQLDSMVGSVQSTSFRCTTGFEENESGVRATKVDDAGEFQRFVARVKSMEWISLHTWIIAGDVNPTTRRPTSLWPNSNRIVLPGFDITDQAKLDTAQKVESVPFTALLRGRHLEGAVLCGADLRKIDLTGARLDGALLGNARLQGALLDTANLQDAKLNHASLQGASLTGADLQRAELSDVHLQGADLRSAQLESTSLRNADLRAASLLRANLRKARLDFAKLQAVEFDSADISGANLTLANLQGASLGGANLKGAILTGTFVWRVDVREITKADLSNATLQPCWGSGDGLLCQNADFSISSYEELNEIIKTQVPVGDLQRRALARIGERLNPARPLEGETEMARAWTDPAKRWTAPQTQSR